MNKFKLGDKVLFSYKGRLYKAYISCLHLIVKSNKYEYDIKLDWYNINVSNVEEKSLKLISEK